MNLLLEVKAIRRCDGGHTCNLVANGRKVAFIAPGIFEWTASYSRKNDVLTWFAGKKDIKRKEVEPKELKDGWESKVPDHKLDEEKNDITETALHEWILLHFTAYEIVQRCKITTLTVGGKGEILDWQMPPGRSDQALKRVAMSRFSAKLLNGLSIDEVVKVLVDRPKDKQSADTVKV